MAKKRQDGEDVLRDIIAKSTNKVAVAAAQAGLASLQERKASISAAIKPVLDVPQIVADPQSASLSGATGNQRRKVIQSDEDVVTNIKKIRSDINNISEESKKSRSLLESILKSNEKYYESNNELLNRLLIANGLTNDKMDALNNRVGGVSSGAGAGVGPVTGQQPTSGPSLFDLAAGGSLLAGAWRGLKTVGRAITTPFRTKPVNPPNAPDANTPKPKGGVDPDIRARKRVNDLLKKGGKVGLAITGLMALGASIGTILSFLDASEEEQATMINDMLGYVPDWLEGFVMEKPDLAFLLGVQLPDLAFNAVAAAKPIAGVTVGAAKAAKGYADIFKPQPAPTPDLTPKSPAGNAVNSRAAGVWNQAVSGPTAGAMANTATSAVEETAKVASQSKTGIVKKVGKVTKETIGAAISKAIDDDIARIAGKKVPLLNIGLGTAFAGLRAWDGDYEGAKLEFMSGLVANLPLLGTAASVTADAYLIARDVYKSLYGVLPDQETDPVLRNQRWNELITTTQNMIAEQAQNIAAQVSENTFINDWFGGGSSDVGSDMSSFNAMGDFGSPIGIEPDISIAAPPASTAPMGRGQYLQRNAATPVPVPRTSQERLNNINQPTTSPNNVIVKQGDTINNVTNTNVAGGGGSAGAVAGSPSKIPSPFDQLLYGDVFNWGY